MDWCPHPLTPMSDSVGLGWSLRVCISNKFQGTAGGLRTTPYTTCIPPLPRRTRKEARMDSPSCPSHALGQAHS